MSWFEENEPTAEELALADANRAYYLEQQAGGSPAPVQYPTVGGAGVVPQIGGLPGPVPPIGDLGGPVTVPPGPYGGPSAGDKTPATGTGRAGDYQGFGQAWIASGGKTPADLKAFVEANPQYGAQIFGSKGDKVRIGGRAFDAVLSAGKGGLGASWNDITDGGGGGASGGMGMSADLASPLLAPWTERFDYPSFVPPGDFQAPDANALFEDPGFKTRLAEGQKAIERAASARGSLNTGGTLKAVMGFGQDLASQEYGQAYGRKASEYDRKYGQAVGDYSRDYGQALGDYERRYNMSMANQDRPFNKLTALAGMGQVQTPWANMSSQMPGIYQQGADAWGQYTTNAAANRGAGRVGAANQYGGIGSSILGGLMNIYGR